MPSNHVSYPYKMKCLICNEMSEQLESEMCLHYIVTICELRQTIVYKQRKLLADINPPLDGVYFT